MLLTGRAKAEAKVLFTFMSQEELTSLAHTVTNHQIDVRTFDGEYGWHDTVQLLPNFVAYPVLSLTFFENIKASSHLSILVELYTD